MFPNIVSFPLGIYDLLFFVELFVMFYLEENTHASVESQEERQECVNTMQIRNLHYI